MSIGSLQVALDKGVFTLVDLVRTYLARISEVNPTVYAVTEINPDALTIAEALDKERTLHGPRRLVPLF